MWPSSFNPIYERLRGRSTYFESQFLSDESSEKQDLERDGYVPAKSRTQRLCRIVFYIAGGLCLWIVLITAWRTTLHPEPRTIKYEKKTLECGNTTTEAEARGCAFDLLSHNWLPQPCLDPLGEAEYREYVTSPDRMYGPYPYFLDSEGTQRVSDERQFAMLANGPTLADQHVFTTREEHLAHCSFLLRRTHRGAEGKVRVNDENLQFWHTEHCLNEIRHADRKPMNELNEGFYVGYAPCTIEVPI